MVVSNINGNKEKEATASASATYTPSVEAVDRATSTKAKDACITQAKTVAANAAREIAGVPPKYYSISATNFGGDVQGVALLHKKTAYEVPFTFTAIFKDGHTETTSTTCRVSDDFSLVGMRR